MTSLGLYPHLSAVHSLQVGLGRVLELQGELLQVLQKLLVALVYRTESIRELTMIQAKGQAIMLAELRPVRQIQELPVRIQQLLGDLQELSKILVQLVINATPLYNMVSPYRRGYLDPTCAKLVEQFPLPPVLS